MEAGISPNQFPDMDFMEEFINKEGYKNWLQHDSAPAFGTFEHMESIVEPDPFLEDLVIYEFRVHVRMPHAHIQQFCEGMETRGWKAFDGSPEPKNREMSLPSSPKLSKSHSPITKETLIKWFERSFSASYSIKITESDPELYQELLQRMEGK